MERARIEVKLTHAQVLRAVELGAVLWPTEKLDISEISRRLLLEHMLFTEDANGMVPRVAVKAWDKEEIPTNGPETEKMQ